METKSISLRQVIDRVRRHPMLAGIPLETIIDYSVDFLRIVGLPNTLLEKTAVLTLKNYRTVLPEDFYQMVQVRTIGSNPIYYKYATDTFHYSPNKYNSMPFTYKIQGEVLYASEEIGDIEISYLAMEVDDCGLPMIPDNAKFLRALEAYIKYQHFTILFDEGKIQYNVLVNTQQEYCWAVGACETEFHMLSLDKAESVANMAKSLIIRDNEHQRGYSTSGNKEYIRVK